MEGRKFGEIKDSGTQVFGQGIVIISNLCRQMRPDGAVGMDGFGEDRETGGKPIGGFAKAICDFAEKLVFGGSSGTQSGRLWRIGLAGLVYDIHVGSFRDGSLVRAALPCGE